MTNIQKQSTPHHTVVGRLRTIMGISVAMFLLVIGVDLWRASSLVNKGVALEGLRDLKARTEKLAKTSGHVQVLLRDANINANYASELLAAAEDFGSCFAGVEAAVLKHNVLHDISLTQEQAPIIANVRENIVAFVAAKKAGRAEEAQTRIAAMNRHIKGFDAYLTAIADSFESQFSTEAGNLERVDKQMGVAAGAICLTGILAGSFTAVRIGRRITRPLDQLTAAVKEISAGRLDFKVNVVSDDEIGYLGESFDHMREAVRHRDASLRESNDALKHQAIDLEKAKLAAEQAAACKSEFLANMSHEIRTPLSSILGYTELLMEPDTANGDQQEYLDAILRNGRHLLSLIGDILDFSKIESGKLLLNLGRTSVHSVVTSVASMLRVRAKEQGLSLTVEFDGELPETILADEARLRQGLVNVVGNAIKFTNSGGVRMCVQFLPDWHGKPAVRIDVIDTGIGISEERIHELCQPFVQADASTSRRFGGTGLGLVITQKLTQMMGGEMEIASKLGHGSIFSMIIPTGPLDGVRMMKDFAEAASPETLETAVDSAHPLTGVSVLLAEDGPDNRRLISTVLRKAGAEVAMAENGREALDAAKVRRFDVILMDMQMPVMDGYEATRRLRDSGFTGPIVALTAHALTFDRERCMTCGCTEYISKPVKRSALISAVLQFASMPHAELPGTNKPTGAAQTQNAAQPTQQPATTEKTDRPDDGPPQDAQSIRSEFADDVDLADIITEFVAGLNLQLKAMRDALANQDLDGLRRLAHQLKGAGGSYGYPCLTDSARALETSAKEGDIEGAQLTLGDLASICKAVIRGHENSQDAKEKP